jgi:hypothetical protein
MKSVLLILIFFQQLSLYSQIDKPYVIYKESDPVIVETLRSMVNIQHEGWFGYIEAKDIYAFWTDNAVLYFGKEIPAQQFSFVKVSFKSHEYLIFSKTELEAAQTDSILDLYQKIKDLPSYQYINNWKPTVDGRIFQIESINNEMDYQLRTYTGIQANLEHSPEAIHLNDFFKLALRIISENNRSQVPLSYRNFYRDHSTGRLVPILSKELFKSLKNRQDLKIKKTTTNKK